MPELVGPTIRRWFDQPGVARSRSPARMRSRVLVKDDGHELLRPIAPDHRCDAEEVDSGRIERWRPGPASRRAMTAPANPMRARLATSSSTKNGLPSAASTTRSRSTVSGRMYRGSPPSAPHGARIERPRVDPVDRDRRPVSTARREADDAVERVGPVRQDQGDPCRMELLDQEAEQVEGRRIRPVSVFDHDDQVPGFCLPRPSRRRTRRNRRARPCSASDSPSAAASRPRSASTMAPGPSPTTRSSPRSPSRISTSGANGMDPPASSRQAPETIVTGARVASVSWIERRNSRQGVGTCRCRPPR